MGFKKVVYNDYAKKNSSASLKFVIDEIEKGTIILNGDLFITKPFTEYIKPNISQLLSQKISEGVVSWGYIVDSNFKLIDIDTNATSGYGDGIAVFDNEDDLKILKKELINCSDDEYWEYCILRAIDKINFYAFNYDDIYAEVDSFRDALYHNLLTPEEIAQQCSEDGKIERLAGITNINYKIKFLNEYKVIRIPGKGTEKVIDRTSEKKILNIIRDKDIAPKSEFYESDIRLTDYLEGYRSLDFDDLKNYDSILPLIIEQIKKLHSMPHDNYENFEVISMIEEIKKYERLANINIVTKIEHKFILNIARKMDGGKQVLCHRDLLYGNIMYNGKDVKLIDFEYSGFSSKYWDLANFICESNVSDEQRMEFIKLYKGADEKMIREAQLLVNYIWAYWYMVNNANEYFELHKKGLMKNLEILKIK